MVRTLDAMVLYTANLDLISGLMVCTLDAMVFGQPYSRRWNVCFSCRLCGWCALVGCSAMCPSGSTFDFSAASPWFEPHWSSRRSGGSGEDK